MRHHFILISTGDCGSSCNFGDKIAAYSNSFKIQYLTIGFVVAS